MSDGVLDEALDAMSKLATLRASNIAREVEHLRAWRRLALEGLDVHEGGPAVIADLAPIETSSGWYCYRECLRPGQTGTVDRIAINPETLLVYTFFAPDTQWSVHDRGDGTIVRYRVEQKQFFMPVKNLRAVADPDKPIPFPEEVSAGE